MNLQQNEYELRLVSRNDKRLFMIKERKSDRYMTVDVNMVILKERNENDVN